MLLFEKEGGRFFADPWRALDSYVDVIGRKSEESWRGFLAREGKDAASWSAEDAARADLLLRMAHESLHAHELRLVLRRPRGNRGPCKTSLRRARTSELARSIDASVAAMPRRTFASSFARREATFPRRRRSEHL
jgi:hypothetical protein